jgi:RNA polymerase sigma factor (sigma-70 family)
LQGFFRKHAGRVLRFETSEDLTQGVIVRALDRADDVAAGDEKTLLAWVYRVARSHLADRHRHWSALKRGSGNLLRLSGSSDATTDPQAILLPAIDATGPSTFASRREQVVTAVRALDLLLERDRELVRGYCDGRTIAEQAEVLGLEYDAARRAQSRALERFRKAFRVLSGTRT